MTNVSFYKGLSNNLPAQATAEGEFYLTTDTNKLYVSTSNKELKPLTYERKQETITIPADATWSLNKNSVYELIITSEIFGVNDEPIGHLYLSSDPAIQEQEIAAYDCISSMEVLEDGIHVYCNTITPTYEIRIKLVD